MVHCEFLPEGNAIEVEHRRFGQMACAIPEEGTAVGRDARSREVERRFALGSHHPLRLREGRLHRGHLFFDEGGDIRDLKELVYLERAAVNIVRIDRDDIDIFYLQPALFEDILLEGRIDDIDIVFGRSAALDLVNFVLILCFPQDIYGTVEPLMIERGLADVLSPFGNILPCKRLHLL